MGRSVSGPCSIRHWVLLLTRLVSERRLPVPLSRVTRPCMISLEFLLFPGFANCAAVFLYGRNVLHGLGQISVFSLWKWWQHFLLWLEGGRFEEELFDNLLSYYHVRVTPGRSTNTTPVTVGFSLLLIKDLVSSIQFICAKVIFERLCQVFGCVMSSWTDVVGSIWFGANRNWCPPTRHGIGPTQT